LRDPFHKWLIYKGLFYCTFASDGGRIALSNEKRGTNMKDTITGILVISALGALLGVMMGMAI